MRSAVVILINRQVALIKRQRAGAEYYLFPGGKVESGETLENAAMREAMEELGVHVHLHRMIARRYIDPQQVFFSATIADGEFGTGTGEELSSGPETDRGSYSPVWLKINRLADVDVRPKSLALSIMQESASDELIDIED